MNSDSKVYHMGPTDWKMPLNLAVGFHILILLSSIYLPGLFKAKPKFADIYTVSIVNVAEPLETVAPAPTPPQKTQPTPVKPMVKKIAPPVKTKKVVPIAEIEPAEVNAPVKKISLKPLKKKVKRKSVKPKVAPQKKKTPRRDDLAQKRRQQLADAIREEELLAERAQLAREAVEMERKLLQATRPTPAVTRPSQNIGTSADNSAKVSGSSSSKIARMYYAAITNKLLQYWALPESMQRQSNLLSIAVITINKNGQIADIFFEQRSGDRVFDQFVARTINAANPMPAIPAAMKKQRVEIGLNFKPGGIQ